MAVRIRKDPDIRRQEILTAARDLIATLGHQKVSVSEIARQVGVSKAAVYFYFESKEMLFGEVIRQELQGPMAAAQAAFEQPLNTEEKLVAMLSVSFSLKVFRPQKINRLIDTAEGMAAEIVSRDIKSYLNLVTEVFSEAESTRLVDFAPYPDMDARMAAELLVTATHGVVTAGSKSLSSISLEKKVAMLVSTFFVGLRSDHQNALASLA